MTKAEHELMLAIAFAVKAMMETQGLQRHKSYEALLETGGDRMRVASYDSPATMCREMHQDGMIRAGMSSTMLAMLPDDFVFPMGMAIGPWKEGQIVGDPEAIEEGWGK